MSADEQDPRVDMLAEATAKHWPMLTERTRDELRPGYRDLLARLDAVPLVPAAPEVEAVPTGYLRALDYALREVVSVEPAEGTRELRFVLADEGEGYRTALTATELMAEVAERATVATPTPVATAEPAGEAADPDGDPLTEARMWARHGYEIGQRSATWSDHGVAPAWLTEGHDPAVRAAQPAPAALDRDALVAAILDIDAHATALGEDADGFVSGGYVISVGSLHRALGLVGHTAVKCQRCEASAHDCAPAALDRDRVADLLQRCDFADQQGKPELTTAYIRSVLARITGIEGGDDRG